MNAEWNRGRITRRRFLAASAAAAGSAAAAFTIVGCDSAKRPASGTPGPTATAASSRVGSRGGIARTFNFNARQPDSFDPHLTRSGPIGNVHSAVFSKLLRYEDEARGTVVPDLADGMPEQPDKLTYIIRLRDNIRFHDTPTLRFTHPKVAGRLLDAEDVKYSIERQLARGTSQGDRFYRQSQWNAIERIDAQDANTLVIRMKTPVAPFLDFLAGRHAFVVPRDLLPPGRQISDMFGLIGSGPFMVDAFDVQNVVKLRRNASWFARHDRSDDLGDDRPFLDGYDAYYSPQQDVFAQAVFDDQRVESIAFEDVAALERDRKTNLGDIELEEADAGAIVASGLLLDRAPFKDDRVRRAVHLAVDRAALVAAMYPQLDGHPSARLSGPIPPALTRWAIRESDLSRRPGYRTDAAAREEDLRAAKQLWSAAMGTSGAEEIRLTVAGIPSRLAATTAAALKHQLHDVLGANITIAADPSGDLLLGSALAKNAEGAAEGAAPFTLDIEDAGVDIDDALFAHFRSGQPMNSYRLQDPTLDAMLDKSRSEFDSEARSRLASQIQDYLLANVNARIEYFAPINRRLVWGYVRNYRMPMWHGSDESLADVWLDSSHPAWRSRQT